MKSIEANKAANNDDVVDVDVDEGDGDGEDES